MAKFKVGDFIRANEYSNTVYTYTCEAIGWVGKVLSIENGLIYAETIKPECDKGERYNVQEGYFDLVQNNQIQKHIVNKNTVVIILNDGRKGIAKCNPTDKFNLAFGTALAVARAYGDKETEAKLLAEPIKEVKEKPKFKVGELVRIRQWDDMVKEFGLIERGSINCNYRFNGAMSELCGKYAEICKFVDDRVCLKFFNCEGLDMEWFYSTDMLEKVD